MVMPDANPSGAISNCFFYFQDDISIAFASDFCVIAALDNSLDDLRSLLSNQAFI